MSIATKIQLIASVLLLILILILCISYVVSNLRDKEREIAKKQMTALVIRAMENAYGMGQAHAISGDVRVIKLTDSTFVWTKSPWSKGTEIPKDTIKIEPK